MDNFGGGNQNDFLRGEALEPDFAVQVSPAQMAAETNGQVQGWNQELNLGQMTQEAYMTNSEFNRGAEFNQGSENLLQGAEQVRNPGVENALGIATVGVAGMTGEPTVAQMSGVTPHDNRTVEEIAIDAPEVAKDGDKMEVEWMERARKAISDTKNDPNKRLLDVALLREEYMRKRFNRILGERNAA